MTGEENVVFSAGNSWIVCRSKSHSGRIYYFNTFTGEAAWNLSDAEIEKAKNTTKCLQKETCINLEECPEPKDPPMEPTREMSQSGSHRSSPISTVLNKQIINNQFPNQPYQMPPLMVPLNSIMPLAVNTQNSGYNSNFWALPSNHQIYIAPTMPSLGNQGQTSGNMAYGNHTEMQNTAITITHEGFQNFRNKGLNTTPQKKFQRWSKFTQSQENNRFRYRKNVCPKIDRNWGVSDLRQVLSAKKRERVASFSAENKINEARKIDHDAADEAGNDEYSSDVGDLSGYKSDSTGNVYDIEQPQKERNKPNDADSDWLEENILVKNRKLKLNVRNLKEMARPGVDLDCWYIVADKDILLYHLHFLNILCTSDDDCYLMVAQQVLAELREMSGEASREAARARRAVSFLLQQVDTGYVVIGDGTCKETGTRCDYLLNCCVNLSEQNQHVVLLSNDEEFNAYKNISHIPIFNVKEIKQFLSKSVPGKESDWVTKQSPQYTKVPIEITVTNDSCQINKRTQVDGAPSPIATPRTAEKCIETVPDVSEVVNRLDDSNSPVKFTIKSGVQTATQTAVEPSVRNESTILTEVCRSESIGKAPKQFDSEVATVKKFIKAVPDGNQAVNHLYKSNSTIESGVQTVTQTAFEPSVRNESTILTKVCRSESIGKAPKQFDSEVATVKKLIKAVPDGNQAVNHLHKSNSTIESGVQTVTQTAFEPLVRNESTLLTQACRSAGIGKALKQFDSEVATVKKLIEAVPDGNQAVNHLHKSNSTIESGVQTATQTAFEPSVRDESTILTQVCRSEGIGKAPKQFDSEVATVKKLIEAVPDGIQAVNHLCKSNSTIESGAKTNTQTAIKSSVPNERTLIFTEVSEEKASRLVKESAKNVTRKDIRLVRSIPVKSSAHNENTSFEKKQFKWRRRKSVRGSTNDLKITPSTSIIEENSRDLQERNDGSKKIILTEEQLPHNKSEESVSSETSSLVVTRNITNDSVVVEETSTSGIISNSSYVDSESESGNKPTFKFNLKQTEPIKNVMFKITGKIMEDSLRIMKDEWVSRFVQIMEEVLTQVLRIDQLFLCNIVYKLHGGGPWTIREAADCIKIKFSNNCDIVDAANKLTNIFMKISDHNGRISANLRPAEYMELYSFGVYLIESLQSVMPGCEDLQSAAQSLLRLLADIQNPNTFSEVHPQDTSVSISLKQTSPSAQKPLTPRKQINRKAEATPEPTSAQEPKNYNLRSKNKSSPQIENRKEKHVTFIRKLDTQNIFFTSLNLVKKSVESSPRSNCHNPSTPPLSNVPEVASTAQDLIRGIFDQNLDESSQECKKDISSPKIIRKFTVCPEFEKNLKKTVERQPLDLDQLDYSANCDEDGNFINEHTDNDEYYENQNLQVYDDLASAPVETKVKDYSDSGEVFSEDIPVIHTDENVYFRFDDGNEFNCDSPLNINKKLNSIFSTIIRRVKEAFIDVQTFCTEAYKELSETQMYSTRRKYEMNENAERAQVLLDNLCKSLNSIVYRETDEPDKNIQALLNDAGTNDFNLNEKQLNCYRKMIGQCLEQALILQESIRLVLIVIKKKPIG